jgi:hypothetical protein
MSFASTPSLVTMMIAPRRSGNRTSVEQHVAQGGRGVLGQQRDRPTGLLNTSLAYVSTDVAMTTLTSRAEGLMFPDEALDRSTFVTVKRDDRTQVTLCRQIRWTVRRMVGHCKIMYPPGGGRQGGSGPVWDARTLLT